MDLTDEDVLRTVHGTAPGSDAVTKAWAVPGVDGEIQVREIAGRGLVELEVVPYGDDDVPATVKLDLAAWTSLCALHFSVSTHLLKRPKGEAPSPSGAADALAPQPKRSG